MTASRKVARQVEYYFGDLNLQRDTFLKEEIAKDKDGWVTLETMMKVHLQISLQSSLSSRTSVCLDKMV